MENVGREERIRTSGPCVPNAVLYQAELLPDPFAFSRTKDVSLFYMTAEIAVQAIGRKQGLKSWSTRGANIARILSGRLSMAADRSSIGANMIGE